MGHLARMQTLNISAPEACTWKAALKYNVKQSKNGLNQIDLETQISLVLHIAYFFYSNNEVK